MSRTAAAKAAKNVERLPLVEEILRPTFRRERRALGEGHLAGRGLRRGRPRAARRSGGGRRRHSRSRAHPARAERFQEARRARSARSSTQDLRQRRGRGRLRLDRPHRPRQHPARLAVGAGARGEGAAGPAQARVRRRPRPHRLRLRLRGGDLRRRAGDLDRGGLDRRQGHARPADDAARPRPSGLRLRAPHGLQRAGALPCAEPARPHHPPSPLVRAGRGVLRRNRGRVERDTLPLECPSRNYSFRGGVGFTRRPLFAARLAAASAPPCSGRGPSAQWFRCPCSSNCCARARACCSGHGGAAGGAVDARAGAVLSRRRPASCRWCWRSVTNSSSAPSSVRRSRSGSPRSRTAWPAWPASICFRRFASSPTFWAVLALGRAIVGAAHAAMAVMLMAGIAVFSVPTPEFGPAILATPLWALMLLHYWTGDDSGARGSTGSRSASRRACCCSPPMPG